MERSIRHSLIIVAVSFSLVAIAITVNATVDEQEAKLYSENLIGRTIGTFVGFFALAGIVVTLFAVVDIVHYLLSCAYNYTKNKVIHIQE